ncbi:MAG: alpha/beta hydrolase [Pseudomonadota bacterium]
MKSLLTLSGSVVLIYLLLVAFYALMQRSLIYYPMTEGLGAAMQLAEAQGGSPWLDEHGAWLGWKVAPVARAQAPTGPVRRALVFHGNAGMALHRGYYADLLNHFSASGPWTVYIQEYPGYGPRAGSPGQPAMITAGIDAVDRLLAEDPSPLLIVGESIGSGVASAVVGERREAVAALLLVTPFDQLVNVARHHMPWLPSSLLLKDRYDNLTALERYEGPLAIVTAGEDDIVPARFAEPLLAQHRGPALHEQQPTAGHNSLHFNAGRAPWTAVDEFLADPVPISEEPRPPAAMQRSERR